MRLAISTAAAVTLAGIWAGADARLVYSSKPDAYRPVVVKRSLADDASCNFYPEIVFVQDVSDSYSEALVNLKNLMPDFFSYLQEEFDGKVRFGIATFVDKPIANFGFAGDFCFDVKMKLTPVNQPDVSKEAETIFGSLSAGGGNDWLEGGNLGMYRAAASDSVGWSTDVDADGNAPVRIIILATDAATHVPIYHAQQKGLELPAAKFSEDNSPLNENFNALCSDIDYPTGDELRAVLSKRDIFPIVLAARPTYPSGDGEFVFDDLLDLGDYFGHRDEWNDVQSGLVRYYEWFLSEFVGVDGAVEYMDRNSESFLQAVDLVLADAREYHCKVKPKTTTVAPSTTQPTTQSTAQTSTQPSGTTTTAGGNKGTVIAIAAAAGGVPVAVLGALGALKGMGVLGGRVAQPSVDIGQDTEHNELPEEREQHTNVTGDLFA